MELLYIIPPRLIIFILAHSDQMAMDFNFFFHTQVLMPSNYNNAITCTRICWFFHYHLKLARSKKKFKLVKERRNLVI